MGENGTKKSPSQSYEIFHTIDFIVKIPPSELGFVQAIIEGYEGEASFTTQDPLFGIGRVFAAQHAVEKIDEVLRDLTQRVGLQILAKIGEKGELGD